MVVKEKEQFLLNDLSTYHFCKLQSSNEAEKKDSTITFACCIECLTDYMSHKKEVKKLVLN